MSWSEVKNEPTQGKHEVVPEGSHVAVCVAVVNLGKHDEEYKGEKKIQHKIMLCWELCNEIIPGTNNRHLIAQTYTLSLNEKAKLTALIKGWFGKAVPVGSSFDIKKVLGRAGLVNISHSSSGEKTYAKLETVSPLPKGMPPGEAKREFTVCGIGEDAEIPEWLPWQYGESVPTIMARSHEMTPHRPAEQAPPRGVPAGPVAQRLAAMGNGQMTTPDNSDDTPF